MTFERAVRVPCTVSSADRSIQTRRSPSKNNCYFRSHDLAFKSVRIRRTIDAGWVYGGEALVHAPALRALRVNRFLNLPSSVDELEDASSKDKKPEKPEKPENFLRNYNKPWPIVLITRQPARAFRSSVFKLRKFSSRMKHNYRRSGAVVVIHGSASVEALDPLAPRSHAAAAPPPLPGRRVVAIRERPLPHEQPSLGPLAAHDSASS